MSDTQSRELHGEGTFRYSPERPYRPLVSPPSVEDKDACAIYASVRRDATPSHEPIELAIPALQKMLHRAGNVDGEGDGCGLLVDIPRKIWAEEVRVGGHDPSLALDDAFAVAHVFVERSQDLDQIQHDARELLGQGGFRILAERIGAVDSSALGPTAREEEPHFWQLAGLVADASRRDHVLFDLLIELEQKLGVHIPSFSATTCVYKVMGAPKVLGEYYPDLQRRARRDDRLLRPQPLLDQHLALLQAGPAVLGARPQRRDQHDRTAAPGGEDAGRADRARLLGLAGPQPHDRHAGQPRRLQPRRGDGDGRAADRPGDPLAARGAARLLHVPAPGDGPVRAGPGGADRPPHRRVRVLRRRPRPAAALAGRDRGRLRLQLRAGRRLGRQDDGRAEAAGARREGAGDDRSRRQALDPARPRRDAADRPRALAGAHRRRGGRPLRPRPRRRRAARGRRGARLLRRRPRGAGQGLRPRPRRLRLAARRRQTGPADGLQRGRADRLARLRRAAGGALARAPEPRRLLQGDGRRRHQPGDRPRARGRALLHPLGVRPPAPGRRRRPATPARSRSPSR